MGLVLSAGCGRAARRAGRRPVAPPPQGTPRKEGRMTRAHGILAAVLVLALAWAFALTQDSWWRPQSADKPIPLWTVEPQDITRIEYTEGASHIVMAADPAFRFADGMESRWIKAEGPTAEAEIAG